LETGRRAGGSGAFKRPDGPYNVASRLESLRLAGKAVLEHDCRVRLSRDGDAVKARLSRDGEAPFDRARDAGPSGRCATPGEIALLGGFGESSRR